MTLLQHYIHGRYHAGAAAERFDNIDPATGEEHVYPRNHSDAQREVELLLCSVRKKGAINPVWWSELVPAAVYP